MIGISCLVKNTSLLNDVKELVEYFAYMRVAKGGDAGIAGVYNDIRKAGIEVDLHSVGMIYNDTLPKEYKQFNTDQQVNDYILQTYNDAVRRAALLEDKTDEKQIGKDKPETYIVNGLLNMFTATHTVTDQQKSMMLQMQNALWKGIQRKLNLPEKSKPANKQEWRDLLDQALGYDNLGITDLNGHLNSIEDLYNAMRDQINDATERLVEEGDYATADLWENMLNGLEASTYSLLFSRGEAKKVLEGILKEAGYVKTRKDGTTIVDWNALAGGYNSIQQLRDNVDAVLTAAGYSRQVVDRMKQAMQQEFTDLHAKLIEKKIELQQKEQQKKETKLKTAQKAIGRKPDKKSDLRRLAELNSLGVFNFNGAYHNLIYNLLEVPSLKQQDFRDLIEIAKTASELYKEVKNDFTNEIYVSRYLQTLQRSIDSIIARNVNNKSVLLKIVAAIKGFFDVLLTGLLMMPFTLLENIYSGTKEIIVPTIGGRGLKKEDWKIYRKMLGDVTARGQSFGEEVGNFAPRELYVNTLKWKPMNMLDWSKQGVNDKMTSLLYALTLPGRIGLLAFDSANKVTITNRVFNNSIYKALTQSGMSKNGAINYMNEALYGESFKDAEARAKTLIEKYNATLPDKYKVPVNSRTITTLANDIVKQNLNTNGALTNDVIEAAYKSAYHVAGYGIGHEANNPLSGMIKGYRDRRGREEKSLQKQKRWNQLARHRLFDTFLNSMVLRFTGGATNWLWLRAQSGWGIGFVTGLIGSSWNSDINFSDKRSIQQSMKDMQTRRGMMGRALIGSIALPVLWYFAKYMLWQNDDDDDEQRLIAEKEKQLERLKSKRADIDRGDAKAKKVLQLEEEIKQLKIKASPFAGVRNDYMMRKLFRKTSPDIMLFHYYMDTEPDQLAAVMKYTQQAFGVGSEYSTTAILLEAADLNRRGESDAANGRLASLAGNRLEVPTWRSYREWSNLVRWTTGADIKSSYKSPENIADGLWGGGLLEDLGAYKRNPPITVLPGVGPVAYEKFKEKGISSMNDLKAHPKWYNLNDKEGRPILSGVEKQRAIKKAEQYFIEN